MEPTTLWVALIVSAAPIMLAVRALFTSRRVVQQITPTRANGDTLAKIIERIEDKIDRMDARLDKHIDNDRIHHAHTPRRSS